MAEGFRAALAILSFGCFAGIMLALLIKRPYLCVILLFILFNLCIRVTSLTFMDLAGPVYSVQLNRFVGASYATPLYVTAYLVVLIPILLLFSPTIVKAMADEVPHQQPLPAARMSLADLVFYVSGIFLVALYVDMLRRGVIPLFARMERYDYLNNFAGPLHKWIVSQGYFLVFWWGMLTAVTWIYQRTPDLRFLGLMALLLIYLFLTGNRFSAFYSFSSFFAMPFGAVVIALMEGKSRSSVTNWRRPLFWVAAGGGLTILLAIAGLAYSYLVVRESQLGAAFQFIQRALVQPSEFAWFTYDRVFVQGLDSRTQTGLFLFFYPIDATKNTTIQYLMYAALGEDAATTILAAGVQFAGGFPEIYFELFGPVLAWPMLLVAGCITGALFLILTRAVMAGHLLTAFFAFYVLFGVLVMFIGGMLNFVLPWTYWVKIAMLGISMALERSWSRAGLRLVPWPIIGKRAAAPG